jgi:hypothetical protein
MIYPFALAAGAVEPRGGGEAIRLTEATGQRWPSTMMFEKLSSVSNPPVSMPTRSANGRPVQG